MRRTVVVATMACASLCSGVGYSQPPDVSEALRGRVQAFQAAWNAHDAAGVAALFSDDADQIMGDGPVTVGRPGLQRWWQDRFASMEPTRRIALSVTSLRLLAPQVAVINTIAETAVQGQQAASSKNRGTWVVVQRGGTWLIAALRVYSAEGATGR